VQPWVSVASSADGANLVAVANNGFIYTSGDSGANWTQRATTQPWISVCSSADGSSLVAVVNNGLIYSSLDGGLTWLSRTATSQAWEAATISGDGTRAAAAISSGVIYDSVSATTVGVTGGLRGTQYSSIELQYVGGNLWMPISFAGVIAGF
jgi:photosystem II stability/assembly factor-like uncharacterized protein